MNTPSFPRLHNYPKGTKVQRSNRYIFIKQQTGQWKAEHRWLMEQKVLGRDLEEGEKVYHRNGLKDDNDIDNLVIIKHSTVKLKPLTKPVVLWIPQFHTMSQIKAAAKALKVA